MLKFRYRIEVFNLKSRRLKILQRFRKATVLLVLAVSILYMQSGCYQNIQLFCSKIGFFFQYSSQQEFILNW